MSLNEEDELAVEHWTTVRQWAENRASVLFQSIQTVTALSMMLHFLIHLWLPAAPEPENITLHSLHFIPFRIPGYWCYMISFLVLLDTCFVCTFGPHDSGTDMQTANKHLWTGSGQAAAWSWILILVKFWWLSLGYFWNRLYWLAFPSVAIGWTIAACLVCDLIRTVAEKPWRKSMNEVWAGMNVAGDEKDTLELPRITRRHLNSDQEKTQTSEEAK